MKCLLFLAALIGVSLSAVHQTRLIKVKTPRQRMIEEGTFQQYQAHKGRLEAFRTLTGKSQANQPIKDYLDNEYLGEVDIGTPAQKFWVGLDTASANLWVVDKTCGGGGGSCPSNCKQPTCYPQWGCCNSNCPNCANTPYCLSQATKTDPCAGKAQFDSSKSSTYVKNGEPLSLYCKNGRCGSAFLGQDKVCIASTTLCYGKQVFGQATDLSSDWVGQSVDGVLGLGWPSIALDHVTPLAQNLLSSLDQKLFTVWMTKVGYSNSGSIGGQVTWGAIDTTNCASGTPTYASLTSQTYWQFQISGIQAGSWSNNYNQEAIADTSTAFLSGPEYQAGAIVRQLGGVYSYQYGLYTVPCSGNNVGDIIVTISGTQLHLTKKNSVIQITSSVCAIAVTPYSGSGFKWILGDAFMREFCTIHDIGNKRIGFIKASK